MVVAESQPGHIDQIKQTNAGAVYRLIDQLGPVSRIDLSRFAQLAPASITKIVREMLEAHLVQETEIQERGSRGRPAVGLMVETEAWHYLAVRISRGEIFHLSLRDLSSKLVVEDQLELAFKQHAVAGSYISHIDRFLSPPKKLERLTSIAITLPGLLIPKMALFIACRFMRMLKRCPLGEALANHTGVPVYIQHDISAWTMAESLFGASRGARDVIQVVIDHNVGAGVITDGHLLHAGSSSLVEIGHTQVDPVRQTLLLRQPWLPGNHRQRRKRAGAGADAHGAVDELDVTWTTVNRGLIVSGGAAGRFVSPAKDIISGVVIMSGGFWRSWSICLIRRKF